VFEHLPSVDIQLVLHSVGVVVQLGDAVSAFNLKFILAVGIRFLKRLIAAVCVDYVVMDLMSRNGCLSMSL
jgi:hypothetical protein